MQILKQYNVTALTDHFFTNIIVSGLPLLAGDNKNEIIMSTPVRGVYKGGIGTIVPQKLGVQNVYFTQALGVILYYGASKNRMLKNV